jgi:hypothetical protein
LFSSSFHFISSNRIRLGNHFKVFGFQEAFILCEKKKSFSKAVLNLATGSSVFACSVGGEVEGKILRLATEQTSKATLCVPIL